MTKKFPFYKIIFHAHVYDLLFKSTFVFFIQSNSYSVLNIELYSALNACYWRNIILLFLQFQRILRVHYQVLECNGIIKCLFSNLFYRLDF